VALLRSVALSVSLATLSLIATAPSAGAAVTIGQTATSNVSCSGLVDLVQPTVTSGNSYVVPATVATGTITSWSAQANAGGGMLAMKVYRPLGGSSYMVVGHDGPRALNGGELNTFPASVAVKAGDVLGNSTPSDPGGPACLFSVPGEMHLEGLGNLPEGGHGDFATFAGARLNVSAVVEPDCDNDGLGDETQDTNLSSCAPGTIPPPAPGTAPATCRGLPATIVGTEGNDVRVGSLGRDVIVGLGGNDKLSGLAGTDVICGGKGNDTLKGGAGNDQLSGQKGNDKLYGQKGNDKLGGKAGKDTLKGGPGKDILKGGAGEDKEIQ
jgi:Ca2+-binding RTX toxin-like protein